MSETVSCLLRKLERGIEDLADSEKYKEYLWVMSKFHTYSVNNTLLILMQYPAATKVAGYRAWQTKFCRNVRKGEKAIKIFSLIVKQEVNEDGENVIVFKGYKITNVFDISQTEGKDLPEIAKPLEGGDYSVVIGKLAGCAGCPVAYVDNLGNAFGSCDYKTIKIRKGLSSSQVLKTLLHEVAHFKLHCGSNLSREIKEVEAESVAFVVAAWLGLDTSAYSFGYVLEWGKGLDRKGRKESFERISSCSKEIIENLK